MGGITFILPFVVIFGIFYFLVILPQRKRQQEMQELIANIKIGETVVTNGGIIGKVVQLNDKSLIIRSADKSNLEIARSAILEREASE
jgi:preprotein translocase subunit YajC